MLEKYLKILGYNNLPDFLIKYLQTPSLLRLKKVGYFCGMDYASKDIYDFTEYISRYDHSLSTALLVYLLTYDKQSTIAGLFHDISTPCFSHVIDYMNQDYEIQETTESFTKPIIENDHYLIKCLQEDNIALDDIVNFKKYSIVDNKRPKLCADRLDGIILSSIGWTKNITSNDIQNIILNLRLFLNEEGNIEIGFKNLKIAQKVLRLNKLIDEYCHSKEDNYMMQLLATITKYALANNYLSYQDLYIYNEEDLFKLLINQEDIKLKELLREFQNKKKEDIKDFQMPKIKTRSLKPLVNGKRI